MLRLFISLQPDQTATHALAQTARQILAPGAALVDPARYHITLAFLGETNCSLLALIEREMRAAAKQSSPFSVALGAVGAFGPVVWRGLQNAPPLFALADTLRNRLHAAGIALDAKPFVPHITLAYNAALLPNAASFSLPQASINVTDMTLFQSTRVQGIAEYIPQAKVGL